MPRSRTRDNDKDETIDKPTDTPEEKDDPKPVVPSQCETEQRKRMISSI